MSGVLLFVRPSGRHGRTSLELEGRHQFVPLLRRGNLFLHGEFDPGSGRTLAARLTHASRARTRGFGPGDSGERVSNTWITCPRHRNSPGKLGLMPDSPTSLRGTWEKVASASGRGWVRGGLACWRGNGPPRRRSIAGLRGRSATLGLRHGPDSYGRQQWGILRNGRKPDAATPRAGRRPSGCKPLSGGTKPLG